MKTDKLTRKDAEALLSWFAENRRDLPWRKDRDPYHVWISEIMLQQTRVEAVKEKYRSFLKELPDIGSLSHCEDGKLMKLWEGLGYYSRARNLRKAALKVVNEYGGIFPSEKETLLKLPGIGSYTAGAVLSIAFGKREPAVDGNVLRVLSRYFAYEEDVRDPKTRIRFEKILKELYEQYPEGSVLLSDLSQSFMELGALVCLPNGAPLCEGCPLKDNCISFRDGLTDQIPFRSALKKRKNVERTLFILRCGDLFLIRKREEKGLLRGLCEFPGTDAFLNGFEAASYLEDKGYSFSSLKELPSSVHVFTHLEWHMKAYEVLLEKMPEDNTFLSLTQKELGEQAFPSAFNPYLKYYGIR